MHGICHTLTTLRILRQVEKKKKREETGLPQSVRLHRGGSSSGTIAVGTEYRSRLMHIGPATATRTTPRLGISRISRLAACIEIRKAEDNRKLRKDSGFSVDHN